MKQKVFSKKLSVGLILFCLLTPCLSQSQYTSPSETIQISLPDWKKLNSLLVNYQNQTESLKLQSTQLQMSYQELMKSSEALKTLTTSLQESLNASVNQVEVLGIELQTSTNLIGNLQKSLTDITQEVQKLERQNKLLKWGIIATSSVAVISTVTAVVLFNIK